MASRPPSPERIAGSYPVLRIDGGATIHRLPARPRVGTDESKRGAFTRGARRIGFVATLGLVYAMVYACAFLLVDGLA